MRKIRVCGIVFFLFASVGFLALAQETNVTGEWDFTIETPRGERTMVVKFVQDGEKITVTMPGFRGDEATGEGTIKGQEIQWSITRSTPRGEFTATYKGKVEGMTMSGTAEMGQMGTMNWKATKK